MTFTMLECFLAAMETLNFTTAAQNTHITQPAFSRNIAAMEKQLGFPLFTRSKQNGVRPTLAGQAYYEGMQKLRDEYLLLTRRAEGISRGESGSLRIGLIGGVCVDSLTMQAIQTFAARYPHIDLQLRCCPLRELIQNVEQGVIDTCLVLGSAVRDREELQYMDIVQVENYLGVPARLNCDTAQPHSLREFVDEVFLLSEDAPELNGLLVAACRQAGFEPKTRIAPDFETKMLWVEFGQGIAVNSKEHYSSNSPCVDFVRAEEIGPDNYALIWRRGNPNPAITLFGAVLRELTGRN